MRHLFLRGLLLLLIAGPAAMVQASPIWQDAFHRTLAIPKAPTRIVSLSPATTENLFAIGAGAKVVGVTADCNYPPQARQKNTVGKFGHVQVEKLLHLKPDLIVATADMMPILAPLKSLTIPVVTLATPSLNSIANHLRMLGQLTGQAPQGQTAANQLEQAIKKLTQPLQSIKKRKTTFYLVWDKPLISASNSSFIGDVLRQSGADNVVGTTTAPFPHYNLERLLKQDPDTLIVPRSVATRLQLTAVPFARLKAVKHQAILRIDDDLISRPGPRIVNAMSQIIHFLYPTVKH